MIFLAINNFSDDSKYIANLKKIIVIMVSKMNRSGKTPDCDSFNHDLELSIKS